MSVNVNEKEYPIRSLEDLCNLVNGENAQRLAVDTAQWLISYQHSIELIRKHYPKETEGKTNTQIAKGSFSWIDDGKNDLKEIRVIKSDE